jgi:hypothetical protein
VELQRADPVSKAIPRTRPLADPGFSTSATPLPGAAEPCCE